MLLHKKWTSILTEAQLHQAILEHNFDENTRKPMHTRKRLDAHSSTTACINTKTHSTK